ncbi:hypothetical protein [Streptomyces sp. SP18CS02]|uniref:hypothetical protein n=1 Tax=Streptomyces sp. SP18CS02 TaxID=3002531 RepID=UPI002E79FB91|nr:hypothetical protein [Streptomyces sp. SP18CS02]MEE1751059.1 hypothetical protein [Streptomyces sp. SP18CS02]
MPKVDLAKLLADRTDAPAPRGGAARRPPVRPRSVRFQGGALRARNLPRRGSY